MSLFKRNNTENKSKNYMKMVTSGKISYSDRGGRPVSPRVAGVHAYRDMLDDKRFVREFEKSDRDYNNHENYTPNYVVVEERKQKTTRSKKKPVTKKPVRKVAAKRKVVGKCK
jgi:hypothetical protein